MKLVRIPSRDVNYPQVCACCTAPSTTTMALRKEDMAALAKATALAAAGVTAAVSFRDSQAAQVPYCEECRRHIKWKQGLGWVGYYIYILVDAAAGCALGFLMSAIAGVAGWLGDAYGLDRPHYWVVALATAIGAGLGAARIRLRPQGSSRRKHSGEGPSLKIARFTASEVVLQCESEEFATKLIAANPGAAVSRAA